MFDLLPTDSRTLGSYRILARLGAGSMGTVYLGADTRGAYSAIKVIADDKRQDPTYRRRFKQEISTLQRLESPYVAAIADVNTTSEPWWYASEFVPGVTLQEAVRKAGGKLPPASVLVLAYNLILALKAFQQHEIVHRDLKPQNIMLAPGGAKVIDFGIAQKRHDPNITSGDKVVGTVAYMSPERLCGKRATIASDIFALGGILVYAATGRQPFGEPFMGWMEVAAAILSQEPNLQGVPQEVLPLVRACLEKDPTRRAKLDELRNKLPGTATSSGTVSSSWTDYTVRTTINAAVAHQNTQSGEFARANLPYTRQPWESKTEYAARKKARRNAEMRRYVEEAQARKQARKARRRLHPALKAFAVILASVAAGGALAEIAPPPADAPQRDKEAPIIQRSLPKPHFIAGTLGAASDPSSPGSRIKVTKAEASGYILTLSVEVSGYGSLGDAPLRDTCIVVTEGRPTAMVPIHSYDLSDPKNGIRRGTLRFFALKVPGKYRLAPRCNTEKGTQSVPIGNNSIDIAGLATLDNKVVVVIASRTTKSGNLVVTIPTYNGLATSQMCLSANKVALRPSAINEITVDEADFTELIFKDVKGGTIYLSCNTSDAKKPTFNGTGVKLK